MSVTNCPHCGNTVSSTDQRCKECARGLSGRDLLADAAAVATVRSVGARAASAAAKICYVFALLGAVLGTFDMANGLANATGAPQQAAAAAMGAAYAVIPYVFARAVDELTR
jgi:hypothetical protein